MNFSFSFTTSENIKLDVRAGSEWSSDFGTIIYIESVYLEGSEIDIESIISENLRESLNEKADERHGEIIQEQNPYK